MEAIFTIGNFYVDIISLIALVAIFLGAINGLFKGFLYTAIKLTRVIVLYLGFKLLTDTIAKALFDSQWGLNWINDVSSYVEGLGGIFSEPISGGEKLPQVMEALKLMQVPDAALEYLSELIVAIDDGSGVTLGMQIAKGIVYCAFIAIAVFIILIGVSIIYAIVLHISKKVNKTKVLGGANRLLGFAFGIIVAYCTMDILIYLISLLALTSPEISQTLTNIMHLNNDEIFTISKFIYNNNLTRLVIGTLN